MNNPDNIREHLQRSFDTFLGVSGGKSQAAPSAAASSSPSPALVAADHNNVPGCSNARWIVVVVTCGTIGLLHVHRLLLALVDHRYGAPHVLRELIIAMLGISGIYLFLRDMNAGHSYEGIIKLVVLLGIANLLLPCIWCTTPRPTRHQLDGPYRDIEEIDEIPSSSGM